MAKVKVINTNLDSNLNGTNFNSIPSETIFSFGSFTVTSNFDGRKYIDYSNKLSTFVRPVTLETMGVSEVQSDILYQYTTNAVLNLNKSDLNTFVRFGSAYEFLRVTIENIILAYPGSLYMNSQIIRGGNITFSEFTYNAVTNISSFRIPTGCTVNVFGLVYNYGNTSKPDEIELKNLNISSNKYVVWSALNPTGNSFAIIGFTGCTANRKYLRLETTGNPFAIIGGETTGSFDFHIKPNNVVFEEFRALLTDYEKYVISERNDTNGFKFILKDPTLLDNGNIFYSDALMLWPTSDKYNIDINTPSYQKFLEILLTIATKYDNIKTDLIARFLTPTSIKTYDLTESGKITKLLRIYGKEFDQLRQFIDSLVNINKITYDKLNNIPDQLIKNLARTFGWNYFSLINETELVQNFLTIDDEERNLNINLLPAEIDVELWRRILINTNYFWKSKGTREAIQSMFLLIGIPEPFINITEYVYTVNGKIDPRQTTLLAADFPSNSLPYNNSGYPVAPLETPDFYFQISGDTDCGQDYMNVFRNTGFNLTQIVDNKKSWIQTGSTTRIHYSTPQYYQEDSQLVLNTKEVDIALDTARGIEYDVFDYIKNKDFPANSSGYTLPFSYVNISLNYTNTQQTFVLPTVYNKAEGDLEIRFNGILLNPPKTGTTAGITYQSDYSVLGNTFTLLTATATSSGNKRDVIQATFIYSGTTHPVSGITVEYVVTRVKANITGTVIPLPSYPRGDVQVTINGIALTKGTNQFNADYILDPNNTVASSNIIIQNPEVISYLAVNPNIQVTYVEVTGSNDIAARSEVIRVDSFNTGKIYFNNSANKYVYLLNYKANSASDIKVLIDGIALEPIKDYDININNKFEVFLPKGIKYGNVISVYYLVANNAYFTPVVANDFGIGDISKLSFLEFIELIQRKLINARTRKTITDFKGGWYPSLLRIYIEYLKRANGDTLVSNGYTFENLYSFLSKYNAFFQKFVDQLLSATIILKKSGLLIRNSVFTKQKFPYKRGVNFDSTVNYLGDDGSAFLIKQDLTPPPPPPPTLYVDTKAGTAGATIIYNTGGEHMIGYNVLTEYGMQYSMGTTWSEQIYTGINTGLDNYTMLISGLNENTYYQYRAYIKSGIYGYTGNTLNITTLTASLTPSLITKAGTAGTTAINNTGGIDIVGWNSIDYYAMQYRSWNGFNWDAWQLFPTLPIAGPLTVNYFDSTITGLISNTLYQYRAYMVVAGTPYYGLEETLTTLSPSTYVPVVSTNIACDITTTGLNICNNTVSDNGNDVITEYGVLYTQNNIYGTTANLVYGNLPTNVKKVSTCGNIGIGVLFSETITGLAPNTSTYYRAFANNSVGIGYGVVKTEQTLPISIIASVCRSHDYGSQSDGNIYLNPALSNNNQCVVLNLAYHQSTLGSGLGVLSQIQIFCQTNGMGSYVDISSTIDPTYSLKTTTGRNCGSGTGQFTMYCGDRICYNNYTDGDLGSYSRFNISSYGSSSDISVSINGTKCGDCVYN